VSRDPAIDVQQYLIIEGFPLSAQHDHSSSIFLSLTFHPKFIQPHFSSERVTSGSKVQRHRRCGERVMDPEHRPAHSCRHCQRIVLRAENVLGSRRIKLPHTGFEIWNAVNDGCALFLLLFDLTYHDQCGETKGIGALRDTLVKIINSVPAYGTKLSMLEKSRTLLKAQLWIGEFDIVVDKRDDTLVLSLQFERLAMSKSGMEIKAHPGT
jgi:hypothetical protein